jgi:putative endopeptidase
VLVSDEITVAVPDVKVTTPLQSINTNYLDKTIRPQDDFFLFSNGTWVKENPVPASESRWGSFNELDKSNKVKLTEILVEATKNADGRPK